MDSTDGLVLYNEKYTEDELEALGDQARFLMDIDNFGGN